jgi:hypothetical protein
MVGDAIDKEQVSKLVAGLLGGDPAVVSTHFEKLDAPPPIVIWSPTMEQLSSDTLRVLLAYWTRLPRGSTLPLASAVDPLEMSGALGYIMLMDVEDDGWDYRFRVFGSFIAEWAGFDATGKLISQLPVRPLAQFFIATYRACLERLEPMFTEHVPPSDVHTNNWQRLILPLEDGNGSINRILVGNVPGPWQP